MIEEEYVSLQKAVLLKEKGFNEKCRAYYKLFPENRVAALYHDSVLRAFSENDPNTILCPTLQMAMRWLREVHHIHICPEYKAFFQEKPKKIYHHWCNKIIGIDRYFKQGIQDLDKLDSDYFYFLSCKTYHDTYEDACEECIEFALKNLI